MKNKNVGFLISGIAVLMLIIILIFNFGLTKIINLSCSHGSECGMYTSVRIQTYFSLTITLFVFMIGIFLIFSKENEKVIIKKIHPLASAKPKKFNPKSMENLNQEEKNIMNLLLENNNSMFQSQLIEKTNLNKVKITRLLDSLESQGLIERKRRGMTNIVMLK